MAYSEKTTRSLVKTITYRILIIVSNFIIALVVTKSYTVATEFTGFTFIINTLLYFFHERTWNAIRWGKKK